MNRRPGRARPLLAAIVIVTGLVASIVTITPAQAGQLSITIDKSAQHAYVHDGGKLIKVIPVSTGANDATPSGNFSIYSKSYWAQASSEGSVRMQYMSRFLGGYGMHAIPRRNGVPLSTPLGQYPVSHGCVRMADADAQWVYENLPIGTPVSVVGRFSGVATPPQEIPQEGGVPVAAGDLDGDGTAELVTGGGAYKNADVRVWRKAGPNLIEITQFTPYGGQLSGGMNVAAGDVDGDGRAEIVTAPGGGGGPDVRVYKLLGSTPVQIAQFLPYAPGFTGGVRVAVGDVDGDGRAEVVTAPGAGGGPHVRVLDIVGNAVVPLREFFPYDASFGGGVDVAVGDVDGGDGHAEVITAAGVGGGPHVRVLDAATASVFEKTSFFAYDSGYRRGVRVAAGDVVGDGRAEIVTGTGPKAAPHTRVFTVGPAGAGEVVGFFAYDPGFLGGVYVASGRLDGPGASGQVITGAGPGAGPNVRLFNVAVGAVGDLASLLVEQPGFFGGVAVAGADVNGDGSAELLASTGPGADPFVRVVRSAPPSELAGIMAYGSSFQGGVWVAGADVDGDGTDEVVTGPGPGGGPDVRVWKYAGGVWTQTHSFLAYGAGFPGGVRVAGGDLDGDGKAEIVTAPGEGGAADVRVWKLSGATWVPVADSLPYGGFSGGAFVAVGDVSGDSRSELVVGPGRGGGPDVRVLALTGAALTPVAAHMVYDTSFGGGVRVGVGDVDNSGKAEVLTAPGPGGGPDVRAWGASGASLTLSVAFFADSPSNTAGHFVGAARRPGRDALVTGAGAGSRPQVRTFDTGPPVVPGFGFMATG